MKCQHKFRPVRFIRLFWTDKHSKYVYRERKNNNHHWFRVELVIGHFKCGKFNCSFNSFTNYFQDKSLRNGLLNQTVVTSAPANLPTVMQAKAAVLSNQKAVLLTVTATQWKLILLKSVFLQSQLKPQNQQQEGLLNQQQEGLLNKQCQNLNLRHRRWKERDQWKEESKKSNYFKSAKKTFNVSCHSTRFSS